MPETIKRGAARVLARITGPVVPTESQCHHVHARNDINHGSPQPLVPAGRVRDDHAGLPSGPFWIRNFGFQVFHNLHAPFFKHARTNSSTVACAPSTACAERLESCASTFLKPRATRAITA